MFRVHPCATVVTEPGNTLSTTFYSIAILPKNNNNNNSNNQSPPSLNQILLGENLTSSSSSSSSSSSTATATLTSYSNLMMMMSATAASTRDAVKKLVSDGFVIFRRYSETESFRDYLSLKNPGLSVPLLPPKSGDSKSATAANTAALQGFFSGLQRLLERHPEIAKQDRIVAQFLCSPRCYNGTSLGLSSFFGETSFGEAPVIPLAEDSYLFGSLQNAMSLIESSRTNDPDVANRAVIVAKNSNSTAARVLGSIFSHASQVVSKIASTTSNVVSTVNSNNNNNSPSSSSSSSSSSPSSRKGDNNEQQQNDEDDDDIYPNNDNNNNNNINDNHSNTLAMTSINEHSASEASLSAAAQLQRVHQLAQHVVTNDPQFDKQFGEIRGFCGACLNSSAAIDKLHHLSTERHNSLFVGVSDSLAKMSSLLQSTMQLDLAQETSTTANATRSFANNHNHNSSNSSSSASIAAQKKISLFLTLDNGALLSSAVSLSEDVKSAPASHTSKQGKTALAKEFACEREHIVSEANEKVVVVTKNLHRNEIENIYALSKSSNNNNTTAVTSSPASS